MLRHRTPTPARILFYDQIVVVTGAASGMGRSLAQELASSGAALALCDIDPDGLADTAERCRSTARQVSTTVVDVADRRAVTTFADDVVATMGIPFAVFNNAGRTAVIDVASEPHEVGKRVFDVNFGGVLHGTKAFLPYLHRRDRGHIVNTSSAFGLVASPMQSSYAASKFAVRGFTEALQHELAISGSGVHAHLVYPGAVNTAIARDAIYPDTQVQRWVTRAFEDILPASSPEGAARAILAGVAADRRRIVVGLDGRLIDLTWRLTGGAYQQIGGLVLKPLLSRIMGRGE
ncbi:short-subunit dehydrogenase [Williamsia limnetica]|uniref:Short-subunit dehydrogenase n=1 Tax=Williamsia limnetica TaxID=882452 RepID=A0A318RKC1_WILLI|nr:SDR family NAD(P)-dependent oxidoreductase [Williamsia limnetica]PYE18509.1 short-subunit dehydrogenase [Williamsia limnetica]